MIEVDQQPQEVCCAGESDIFCAFVSTAICAGLTTFQS
jgi:hypothetical protein